MSVIILTILLLVLILVGMPIGFVLLIIGSVGVWFVSGWDALMGIMGTTAYRSVNGFSYTTIPMFILMANFISKSRIAEDLFDCVLKWIGHKPGGVGVTTVFSSAAFGTLSGSSIAATSIMSKVAVPQMIKSKYSDSFSAGLVASSSGTLAALIPPSVPLIVYAIQTETSIGKLLISGIIPGLLLAFLLCIVVVAAAIKNKSVIPKSSWRERFQSLKHIWPILLLILAVIIAIYAGIGTSTEAAAFGAFGALVIGLLIRRLNFKAILDALIETVQQTCMIFVILVGATLFSYFVAFSRLGNSLISYIESTSIPALGVLVLIVLMYLILGLFLDLFGSMLLTLPLVFPLITDLGYDPLWFGILVVLLLEIGLVTPPVGINLYITSQQSGISVNKVLKGSVPFIGVLLLTVILIIIFPEIVLYLPSKM
ncbi:TRAP transporter large permease [Neobacillus citreus]|uniref:TRAP transporter large permease n=1 Tax=Neobacillus citreus TaxID=2833578 RepID=A0A942YDS1_9BACI|nr:TRAP transporter large permease [Neobacillus citreus]MCH6265303.1 TRAP transporter large permease [Neobacillus citreus]